MAGIVAYGGYVPRLRLQRAEVARQLAWSNGALRGLGKGERAVCAWDEDAVTMAVEAARDALNARERAAIAGIWLASTTLPFQDRRNSTIVGEALNLDEGVHAMDVTASMSAGVSGLIAALNAAEGMGPLLFVASEKRRTRPASELEMTSGHAAAAFLIAPGDGAGVEVLGMHTSSIDFVDHYRGMGEKAEYDYVWESRWVRDEGFVKLVPPAVKGALDKAGLTGGDVTKFIFPTPVKRAPEGIATACGIVPEACVDQLGAVLGDAGTAHALVLLAHTLESAAPGDVIVLAGWGSGVDALVLKVTDKLGGARPLKGVSGWLERRKAEDNYVRYLAHQNILDIEKGLRAEADKQTALTVLYRNRKMVTGLVGGRDRETGLVQFPPTPMSMADNNPGAYTQDAYPLADKPATIMTFTADNLTYTPEPPAYYGMITFEGGGRMMADFTDVDADDVEVGRQMRMMFRVKAIDEARGFTKYFWKAVPA